MTPQEKVKYWMSCMNQIQHETNGFTLDLSELTVSEICNIKPVTSWMIEMIPFVIPSIHLRALPKFKADMVYVANLREKQAEAWNIQCHDFKERHLAVSKAVKELQKRLGHG